MKNMNYMNTVRLFKTANQLDINLRDSPKIKIN